MGGHPTPQGTLIASQGKITERSIRALITEIIDYPGKLGSIL
jgi:hypothetical protein